MKENIIIQMTEAFKSFKARNKKFWSLTWRKDVPELGGTTAVMFENTVLDQTIRLEELKTGKYKVQIFGNSNTISSNLFDDFESAKKYVIDYMENRSEQSESARNYMEKVFLKSLVEKTIQGTRKEENLFVEATNEYLRILNLIVDNKNVEEKTIEKSKEIVKFIKSKM
jgi:hypothetical protein